MTNTGDGTRYKSSSFRAEAVLVERAREIFAAQNLSMSAAITLFLEACVREGRIPDAVMSPGSSSQSGEYFNAVLRSVTPQLNLPDFGNPLIPSDVFANEIELEFSKSILCDCYGPWLDEADAIMELSSWEPYDDGEEFISLIDFYDEINFYEEFLPSKFPYDYARSIVEGYTKDWAKAEQDAKAEITDPYDAIMGNLLKRSHLTLDELMDRLVEAGVVDEKDGETFNRSLGRMAEELVAFLKENGLWDAPKPACGVPFIELKEGFVDELIDETVAYRVESDCSSYLAYEHPIAYMFEEIPLSMNQAIEDSYSSLFDITGISASELGISQFEVLETLVFLYDSCKFKYPPKTVYDECVKRYLDAMENAEPGTVAAKNLPYAKAPFDYSDTFLYPLAIDMDAEVWVDLYNREAFYTTVAAVADGVLPDPSLFM